MNIIKSGKQRKTQTCKQNNSLPLTQIMIKTIILIKNNIVDVQPLQSYKPVQT